MYKYLYILVSFCILPFISKTQEISVSIFHDRQIYGSVVTIQKGLYLVYNGSEIVDTLHPGNNITVVIEGDYAVYRHRRNAFATDHDISLKSEGESSFFINYTGSVEVARCYDGWLKFKMQPGQMMAINYVSLESYVASVVEAHGALHAGEDFYKAQAIMARTYALKYINKHSHEGFELCDGSHCQVYKFRPTNRMVIRATNQTQNMVIVDKDIKLIDPIYHLNSGGQTLRAGIVFDSDATYLASVIDKFAENGPNYSWQTTASILRWKEFLLRSGIRGANNAPLRSILVEQTQRLQYYIIGNDSIKISDIAREFGLKSDFFSMSTDRTNVVFEGRGSGHGVGLSQESAIEMARAGFNHERILEYFYKDFHIVNLNMLPVFNIMKQNIRKELP